MTRFVFSGGHHNSALIVATALKSQGHQIYWYGHRYSSRTDTNDSAEYIEVTAAKIPFFDLPAGRFRLSLSELSRIPRGFLAARAMLRSHRPKAVISFGGYLGAATALAAATLRIPLYLHEQTSVAGLSNQLTGLFARRIYLTYPESSRFFPAHKTRLTGLPLRPDFFRSKPLPLFTRRRPALLIMGGKQGSHALNQFVFSSLPALLNDYNLIHQTGTNSATGDYERALALQGTLGSLSDCYHCVGYIPDSTIGSYFATADLYLGRSGAHICYELLSLGKPSLLVPLPAANRREQEHNASFLVSAGCGVILPQSELSLARFRRAALALKSKPLIKPPTLPLNATETIVHELNSL